MLFENQQELEPDDLTSYAAALGLDLAQFAQDMESEELAARIQEDFMSGVRSGVNGTPTFFINGTRYNGETKTNDLLAALGKTPS